MREILFRGKRTDNGEWVYGYYYHQRKRHGAFGQTITEMDREADFIISFRDGTRYEADPKTVSQYTGLPDRNKKRIYENDIVLVTDSADELSIYGGDTGIGKVEFFDGLWYVDGGPNNALFDLNNCGYIEAIGNIYDNPEFLEERL